MKYFIFFLFILSFNSCNKNNYPAAAKDKCLVNFAESKDLKISKDHGRACIYYDVFIYDGQVIYKFYCCTCRLIPSYLKCDGELFVKYDEPEYEDVEKNAVRQEFYLVDYKNQIEE